MLDAVKEQQVWVVPAVLGMAVTLKYLSEQADQEQSKKGVKGAHVRGPSIMTASIARLSMLL
jgi:hypothetical protein